MTSRRQGITLVEVLVVIAIISMLIALIVPAVQTARECALRVHSVNNLRQLNLATQGYCDNHNQCLPSYSGFNALNDFEFSLFVALMPYLEQGSVYAEYTALNPGASKASNYVIPTFISPADPTLPASPTGMTSYGANAAVYAPKASLKRITDGTSNTVGFSEHYAFGCDGVEYSWFSNDRFALWNPTGPIKVIRRGTFGDKDIGDVFPVTLASQSEGSVPGVTFQYRPTVNECDPSLAQTPHLGGMLAAFCDGSVRCLAPTVSVHAYWGAITPRSGDLAQGCGD